MRILIHQTNSNKIFNHINLFTMKRKTRFIVNVLLFMACSISVNAQGPYPNTGAHTVCLNATEPYGVVLNSGSTYQWTVTTLSGGNGAIIPGATSNLISVNWTSPGTATLQLIETNSQGCAGDPVNITVTILPLPTASVSGTTPICLGSDAIFTITGTPNASVTYSINGGANKTITLSSGGTATVTVTGATANQTLNLVSVSNPASGCSQTLTGSFTITVNALPTATVSGTSPICSGSDAIFNITGTPNASVTYNINGGTNQTATLSSVGTGTVTITGATTNQTLNLVSVSVSSSGCSQLLIQSFTIVVNATLVPTITGPNPICVNTSGTYITETGMNNYVWNVSGGTITAGTGTSSITVNWTNTGNQTVTINYTSNGCSSVASTSKTVVVNPKPATTPITHN